VPARHIDYLEMLNALAAFRRYTIPLGAYHRGMGVCYKAILR
jgi:hypothetical protein